VRTSLGVPVVFRTDWVPRYRTADVYVIPTGGGRLRTLTRNDVNDFDPAWSADGRRIVFASRRTGNTELHVMNAGGSSVRRLTHTQSREVKPAWSLDGRQIAFVSDQTGRDQIYVMSPNGSARRRMTNLEQCASDPSWARDGSRIFGTAGACSEVSLPFSVHPDGSQLAFIRTQPPGDQSDADPALSPDGSRLAFTRIVWQLNTTEVWIARADGSDARRVARDGSLPAWSPDGRRLAFVHGPKLAGDENGYSFVGGPKVAVMNASGSGLKHLTAEPTYVYGGVGPSTVGDGHRQACASLVSTGPPTDAR
jgi:Tol biopolymer transport system component